MAFWAEGEDIWMAVLAEGVGDIWVAVLAKGVGDILCVSFS